MTSDSEKVESTSAPAEGAEATKTEAPAEKPAEKVEAAEKPAAAEKKEEKAEPTLEQKLAEAQGEVAKVRDQLLRTAADFDNFRKRARRNEDEERRRGRELLLKDLLPVFDNLERAVQHADGAPDVKSLADGLRMVLKQFVDTLDRGGIKRVPTIGHAFDPTKHEAIQHLESKEQPAGVVLHEVQPGYMIGDYLVRAAMVVVSKGAPEAETPAS